jgi:PPP family 3-phenylpropionic acid transporter
MWSFGVLCEIVMLYFQGPLLQRNLLSLLQFTMLVGVLRWMILWLYADSVIMTFASQSLHAVSFALYHTAAITYVYSLYTQKKLAQQFFLGIAFGLGGSVGAFLSGKLYGENLFLYEALITLSGAAALFIHQKRKERIVTDV